jgi:hypothetical protein
VTGTCPAAGCGAQVTEARDIAGGLVLLAAKSPHGKLAVKRLPGGTLQARPLVPSRPLESTEERWAGHTCAGRGGGLAEVRSAQSAAAHQQRVRRGRPAPPRNRFGQAAGVRVLPPGDVR